MNRFSTLFVAFLFCFSIGAQAQTTNMGIPASWKDKLAAQMIPVEVMPGFDLEAVQTEDSLNDQFKSAPWRFGYRHPVNFNLSNSGVWSFLPNGDRIWRMELHSRNALSMNVFFNDFFLPRGATLHVYSADRSRLEGAYTNENNQPDRLMVTLPMPGDRIVLEYYEPAEVLGQGELSIGYVIHGYRNIGIFADRTLRALGDSGPCNIDVNCPQGNGWEDQKKSVAMMMNGGNGFCTGALVNNVANDGTPYFLSANHCGTTGGGGIAFLFRWEAPVGGTICAANGTPTNGPTNLIVNGATLRANNGGSDVALWELNSTPPNNYNVYYAGWDRSGARPTAATCIHHPSGDIKKICFETDSPYQASSGGAQVWWIDEWEDGVTEPGSSGSPLFDQNQRVVGQLYGGAAACAGTNNNGQYDFYGRFDVSWDGTSASRRLRDWLDPSNSSVAIDGYDPNAPTAPNDAGVTGITNLSGIYCGTTDFIPEIVLRNYGSSPLTSVTITYIVDGGAPQQYNWTGNLAQGATTTVMLPMITVGAGSHTLDVSTSNPNGSNDPNAGNNSSSASWNVVIGGIEAELTLTLDCWGSETTWELRDGNGTAVYTGGPYSDDFPNGSGPVVETFCLNPGCYDFIIEDSYGDGLYGSQYPQCGVDGNYLIVDANQNPLVTMTAPNGDFGSSTTHNFCVMPMAAPVAAFTANATQVCEGSQVSFTDQSTNNPSSWTWSFPGGSPASSNSPSPTVTYNSPGTYNVSLTVTNGVGNDAVTQSGYITVFASPSLSIGSVSNATCMGASNGSASLNIAGGTPPYSFDWGGLDPNNLPVGTHTAIVTDNNGCTDQIQVTIGASGGITASVSPGSTSCNGANDGTATATPANGTAPYTYVWSGSASNTATVNDLSGGNQSVTITDAIGCMVVQSFTISEPAAIQVSGNASNASCNGASDGSISISGAGGTGTLSYSIDGTNFSGNNVISGLAAGTYIAYVQDGNGCIANSSSITISEPSPISASASVSNDFGGNDGSIILNSVTGGQSPYSYSWSNGATSANIGNLTFGTYTVTITDANGCTMMFSYMVDNATSISELQQLINGVNVFPNPANSYATVTVEVNLDKSTELEISVMDALGRVINNEQVNGVRGANAYTFRSPEVAGLYLVSIRTKEGAARTTKLVIR